MSTNIKQRKGELTHSTSLHLLGRHPDDVQHLRHDFYSYVRHSSSRWHPDVNLEPTEEVFDPSE